MRRRQPASAEKSLSPQMVGPHRSAEVPRTQRQLRIFLATIDLKNFFPARQGNFFREKLSFGKARLGSKAQSDDLGQRCLLAERSEGDGFAIELKL